MPITYVNLTCKTTNLFDLELLSRATQKQNSTYSRARHFPWKLRRPTTKAWQHILPIQTPKRKAKKAKKAKKTTRENTPCKTSQRRRKRVRPRQASSLLQKRPKEERLKWSFWRREPRANQRTNQSKTVFSKLKSDHQGRDNCQAEEQEEASEPGNQPLPIILRKISATKDFYVRHRVSLLLGLYFCQDLIFIFVEKGVAT